MPPTTGAISVPSKSAWKGLDQFTVIDTRRGSDYRAGHIPGARHIEWREILEIVDEPRQRPLLLYCDTGSLSAQAALALKLLGAEDVLVLTGGLERWVLVHGKGQVITASSEP